MGCAASKKVATEPQQPISISDFTICYRIGNSPNAYVTLAEKGNKYCIKYVYKNNKNKPEALVNAIAERNFLAALHHPFIVPLRYAFQDDQYYFIVCDFYEAGDLRGVMDSMDFTEQQIRFIGAELVLALEYLHSLEVVHRDIKPDNIFMSIHGHVYLSDFELAFGATKPIRANSGTEAYMAPEMHQNHGHSLPVDIWALGVTFFELYFRNRPFRTQKKKELIIAGTFTFPTTKTISNDFKRLIERMLQVDPLERPLIKGVKYHPFFQNVKWTQIFQKSVQSPITP
ncbi:kinase-like domain-containing protein, partial [Gorgonomyces haynaldii]